jgi:hypothetical protein
MYTIFTQEFGKIFCQKKFSKREKALDIWYMIQVEIETKEDKKVHKMRNIKILSDFAPQNRDFWVLNSYLEMLAMILRLSPDGLQIYQVLEIVETIHDYENITEEKILLAKLKLSQIYWNLWLDHKNQTLQRILWFIHKNNFSEIVRLSGLNEDIKKDLEELL